MTQQFSPVAPYPSEITIGSFETAARDAQGVVVVIDVFRAFTTAAIALANGAKQIVMVDDLDKARTLRERSMGRYCIGERGGIAPHGFDFGNSPAEIRDVRFEGETVIQTTSNGTRGILAASRATHIYAGSFASAFATISAIRSRPQLPVTLVAMGEGETKRADEDEICALYLRSLLLCRSPDQSALRTLVETMSRCTDSKTLSKEDVHCCLSVDTVPFAIRVVRENGLCIATPERALK